MTLVDIDAPQQVRRDRWGRYLVTPPDGGKPIGYQRATTLAKMLEDTSNLTRWSARMTLLGAAQRPDIIASALAADPSDRKTLDKLAEQAKEHGGANVRRDLGTAVHKFLELAHADPTYVVPEPYAADIAAIRTLLDDAGFDVVPEYSERILVVDSIQVAGMCDMVLRRRSDGRLFIADLKTGSSVQYGSLGWAVQLSIYSQADAIYEQGQADDGSDDRRLPVPDVDRLTALIIHCEPQSGSAQLHQLAIGHKFVDLAVAVREVRKRRDLLVPFQFEGGGKNATTTQGTASTAQQDVVGTVDIPTDAAAPVTSHAIEWPEQLEGENFSSYIVRAQMAAHEAAILHEARTAWLIKRVYHLIDHLSPQHVAEVWPTDIARPSAIKGGTATWTDDDIDTVAKALDALEAKHDVPFGDEDPKTTQMRRDELARRLEQDVQIVSGEAPTRKDGVLVTDSEDTGSGGLTTSPDTTYADPDAVDAVMAIVKQMAASDNAADRERIGRVQAWQRQASNKGVGWKIGGYRRGEVPERLYAIVAAAVGCLDLIDLDATDPDRRVRRLLLDVYPTGEFDEDELPHIGVMFGLLTTDQALRLAEMAEAAT